ARRWSPVELECSAVSGPVACACRGMRDEGRSGGTRLGSVIFANYLGQVIDRSKIAGLPLFEIAVQTRRHFEAPPALIGIGNLHRNPLSYARNIERAALQENLHAPCAGI